MKSLRDRILSFNAPRQQPTRSLKYKLMAAGEFTFYRATCHLFYEDLASDPVLRQGPPVWVCGDLHLENFGSYRAGNGLVYFDINDFDEGALAPASWELARFLCSIAVAADDWKYSLREAENLMLLALKTYCRHIEGGKAYAIERETSPPLIQEFFAMAEQKKEKELLKARVDRKKKKLKLIPHKTWELPRKEYDEVKSGVNAFLKERYGYFSVKDVAFRIAGTGSLGIRRYALLVEDRRHDKWRLLDVKQSLPGSLQPYLTTPQPKWASEADRIIGVQMLMQYALPRFIDTVSLGDEKYVLKALQPTAQKIDRTLCHKKMKNVETVIITMAGALASAQLRSAARRGSATVEELMAFAAQSPWQSDLVDLSMKYFGTMKNYFKEFKADYRDGKYSE